MGFYILNAKPEGNSAWERIAFPKPRRFEVRIRRRTHASVRRRVRSIAVIQPRFRVRQLGPFRLPTFGHGVGSPRSLHRQLSPNKAPEPTTTAVMPRAIADSILIARLAGARVTPAVVVAHL